MPTEGVGEPMPVDLLIGRRIGAFRLVEPIGHGGMGVVYRAERVDGDFGQRIAIKLLDLPSGNPEVLQRFRIERHILASLSHPHIVTLLDGGLTDQGQPYLAMEYVEGVPITAYCEDHRLALADRLQLLQQVCGAVQYAHEHGVVHRDLKPANILVSPDGVPKVLDFGVAKLLDPSRDSGDRTETGALRPMTPNYASPEQLRGLPVTTASDIYALAVLFYEVLAGVRPYDTTGQSLDEVLRTVVERVPRRPSAMTPPPGLPYDLGQLKGDLDGIVLKAMSKEALRRYGSARELSDDVGRYLAGLPVLAREPSLAYLVAKTARRHRVAAAAVAVSIVVVLGALAVSLWQTRIAVTERNRATQRFNDIRGLAQALIFKIDDAVRPLPGSTPVRQMIVAEALTYLERLRGDPSMDDALRLELAAGYHRVGDVQGNPSLANLGDRNGARTSYQKAVDLLRPLATRPRPSRSAALELGRVELALATTANIMGATSEAQAAARDATRVAESWLGQNPGDSEAQRLLASSHFQSAILLRGPESLTQLQQAGEIFDRLLADKPDDLDRQRNAALVQKYVGSYYEAQRDFARALPYELRGEELDEKRLAADPANRLTQFDLAIDLSNVAFAQWQTGHLEEAATGYERSLAMRLHLAEFDPKDVLARSRVEYAHSRLGRLYTDSKRFAQGIEHARAAVAIGESMATIDVNHEEQLADDLLGLGLAEAASGRHAAACQTFQRALSMALTLQAKPDLSADLSQRLRNLMHDITDGRAGCGPPR